MSRRLALVIGNSEYQPISSLRNLPKAANDAIALAKLLEDPAIGNFEIGNTRLLINKPSIEAKITIEDFFKRKKSDDLLLLYFAGHGLLDADGRLYLVAPNTQRENMMSTAIEARFIAELMHNSDAKSQILILDCCNSGAFARDARASSVNTVGTYEIFKPRRNGYARVIFTATDATESAYEGEDSVQNSIFTRFLIQGLQTGKADKDDDGEITHDELFEYVRDNVIDFTSKQTPYMWTYEYKGKLPIARNPYQTDLMSNSEEVSLLSNRKKAASITITQIEPPKPKRETAVIAIKRINTWKNKLPIDITIESRSDQTYKSMKMAGDQTSLELSLPIGEYIIGASMGYDWFDPDASEERGGLAEDGLYLLLGKDGGEITIQIKLKKINIIQNILFSEPTFPEIILKYSGESFRRVH